ncbi:MULTISPECIES: hypothetical protein [unclassified Streptomyces]|uniref:hypothetical protein n=1 Tax=unclassified Streptomyces TaxID=2593676 RepID=UPI002E288605|nr:hypothetical protein [Streptomyces sp. NBC_00223]
MEAAERLVLRVEGLRLWLVKHGFMRMHRDSAGRLYAATDFDRAYAEAIEMQRSGGDGALAASGLNTSEWSVLGIAANLSGKVGNSLRYSVHNIDADHASLAAEAVLYAMGYMDATIDVVGNEVDGIGPNGVDYERRLNEG